jgi:hypothetical protein
MSSLLARLETIVVNRQPSLTSRVIVAVLIGLFGAAVTIGQYSGKAGAHTDFGMLWFGARSLFHGMDPYPLIGPGRAFNYTWPLIYPLPAVISVMPLAGFAESVAATLFVGLSSALLSFGLSRDGWYRMPLFISEAFLSSARLGQWSILLTAALFLPWLAIFAIAKPQSSIPVLAGSTSRRPIAFAIAGGVVLLAISTVLQPHWIAEWFAGVRNARHMEPPITRFAGFLVLLVLLRWRRPESWLVLSLACLPQSWGWYGTLPLFTVPATFGQAVFLAGVAVVGGNVAAMVIPAHPTANGFYYWAGSVVMITIYLPSVILILRRPNEGPLPAWMDVFRGQREAISSRGLK